MSSHRRKHARKAHPPAREAGQDLPGPSSAPPSPDATSSTHADPLRGDGGGPHPGGTTADAARRAQVVINATPATLTRPPTAFLSGEDPQAKQTVHELLTGLGRSKEWITDLGEIETARATEAAMPFVPHVLRTSGFTPFAISIAR